ncbi:methyl-accepting chemotaxis protein [Methylomonas sp. EFPC1]|uniref:Methyl-accepting chemotaxis protein n=1 Tax=Methylomonas defluvii TaxID=3045149 RepID=A0ABU4UI22_9GAMM|nr:MULTISPECIES: methyl-accepting chemotaxis protein [unclassified Methylomonas]MDX8129127.1 methyl-accepting chemotaxis protein [Methylomonas sp. OY6]QSA99762.1 methyl-accepting chemotaxis protein [Methylomonas sp. EFPC1]
MLNRFSIAAKLQLMSWFASLLLAGLALLGYHALDYVGDAAHRMGKSKDILADILPPPLFLVEAQLMAEQLYHDKDKDPKYARLKELKIEYDTRNRYWESAQEIPAQLKQAILGTQREQADQWWKELEGRYIPAIKEGDVKTMDLAMERLDEQYERHREALAETVKISNGYSNETLANLNQTVGSTTWYLVGVALLGAIAFVIMAYVIIQQIRYSLDQAEKVTGAIAAGDLTVVIPDAGDDEIGQLLRKLAQMRKNLHNLISDMHNGVFQLNRYSADLLEAAAQESIIANNGYDAACSMAATIEQLSVSLEQVNGNALDAKQVAFESGQRAELSTKVISSTAIEMQKISAIVVNAADYIRNLESISSEITSIVDVIHGVAEQTNLLALNAAIEAARAGEYGRGFAVVADEVRTLAERTSTSSGEIKLMVEKIRQASKAAVQAMESGVTGVESGVALSSQAGQSVNEILDAQYRVTLSVDGISGALGQQSAATRDMANRVEQISQNANSLAKTVEKTKQSAEQLAQQAASLDKLAARFKL